MGRILVVDDEPNVLDAFEKMLSGQGHEVKTTPQPDLVSFLVEETKPELLIMDINMPGMNGLKLFECLKDTHPKLPVIMMTAFGSPEAAIESTKLGAFEFLMKPFEPDELLRIINKALESARLMEKVEIDPLAPASRTDAIIGQSPYMREVYKSVGRVAETDATVLIRGETGTGKELVARAIYQHSLRKDKPLLVVNCVAIPETLLESELFGYEKGAFTGAQSRRIGKFEQASGGTIFLDEIGDIPSSIQSKILRVLQDRRFERIGGNHTVEVDVRILSATNRDLEEAIKEGKFREDLFHRLNVVTIHVPALRERPDDIPRLVDYFMDRFAGELHLPRPPLSADALKTLQSYLWPGNVRELQHCIHRALIFTHGRPIHADDIRRAMESRTRVMPVATPESPTQTAQLRAVVQEYLKSPSGDSPHYEFLARIDKLLVLEALRLSKGNQTRAAKLLGLTRPTLQAKMQKYDIRKEIQVRED